MRTNEERARLVHKRTAEIKREWQKKKQRALDMICGLPDPRCWDRLVFARLGGGHPRR